ncbi:TonB-dependent receptor [Shewanella cyperi]|uniref:TonB-dependent receptor n=1 Tax=Shewanella cyperi TaxID=2814292 RepID=UPI001A93D847|nr:TonB-dependent receptor [Shewanella cyperi]QSX41408.1 TonB-dependent receptor [Shewanella cyperi]
MKKSYLALLIGAALALPAYAADETSKETGKTQDETATTTEPVEQVDEVITVRGIRSSLKEGQEIKKLADNVVDAIVAEDIGKFPDENVAEALQRIPGVSVTRVNGEGQTVTVRGLTGNYNITTLNGRKLASDNASRDFNYDVIASELISGIQVHKTPQGHLPEGGIGAVVNVSTARPLDIGEFAMVGSVRGAYNERSESLDPRASFMISDTFNDDTLGILLSLTHSSYTNRHDSYQAWSFHERDVDLGGDGTVDYSGVRFPGYAQLTTYEDQRDRTGGTFALQWRPQDNLDITLDGLYSVYDIDSHGRQLSVVTYSEPWLPAANGNYTDVHVGTDGWAEDLAWEGPALMDIVDTRDPRRNTTYQVGLNFNWMLDDLTLVLDMAHSEAKNENNGDNKYVVARTGVNAARIDWNTGNAVPDIQLSEEVTPDKVFGAWYTNTDGTGVEDATSSITFDGTWERDGLFSKLFFGAGYNSQEKQRTTFRSRNPSIFAGENLDKVNADASHLVNFYGHEWWQLPSSVMLPGNVSNFMGSTDADIPANWAAIDLDGLYDFLRELDPVSADLLNTDVYLSESFTIKEEILHAYVETNLEDSLFDMPFLLNLGLRYAQTRVTSSGYSQNIHKLKFGPDGEPVDDSWKETQPVSEDYSYGDWLPSMNFKLSLTDELVFRTSLSQVISRPSLWELSPYTSINIEPNEQGVRSYSMSVPDLKPYTADQWDTALEWYYSDEGTLAFATFYKEVASFIKWDKTQEEIDGQPFEVWKPYNDDSKKALIRGLEVAWLQTFDELLPEYLAGFGVQANYTYNDSVSGEKDDEGKDKPFRGLSDHQYNLVAFYEKDGLEARIAYNYRSGYTAWDNWSRTADGWISEPVKANPFSWLDLSASYAINDHFTLTADVSNLQDKVDSHYLGDPSHIQYAATYGRRFSLGIRASF